MKLTFKLKIFGMNLVKKKYEMLKRTHSRPAPWNIVRSDNKHKARMEAIKIVLNSVDYDERKYSLDFNADDNIYISVQNELSSMSNKRDYYPYLFTLYSLFFFNL